MGTGFNTAAEKYMGRCIRGQMRTLPWADTAATLKVTSMADSDKAQQQLGFELGSKAHFGIGRASLQAQAAASMTRDAFSSVWVLSVRYVSEAVELDFDAPIETTLVGQTALDRHRWRQECGDEFVYQTQKGAQLFVVYRLDYKSENFKNQIETQLQGARGILEISAQLKKLNTQLAQQAQLSLEVYQFGGEPVLLGSIVTGSNASLVQAQTAAKAVIQCGTENVEACDTILTHALLYATSPGLEDAFAKQVARAAKPTLYITAPWSRLGYPHDNPPLDPNIQTARLGLAIAFDQTLATKKRVELLLASDWIDAEQREELLPWQSALTYQQGQILAMVDLCYDALAQEPAAQSPATQGRCMQAEALLRSHNRYPPAYLLRGAVERSISRTWQTELHAQGDDPARRVQQIGPVTCGFAPTQAICGYRGARGNQAFLIADPVFDLWTQLPETLRDNYATYPAEHTQQQNRVIWNHFFPQSTIFTDLDDPEARFFLAGPLWRCWRRHAKIEGPPQSLWGEDANALETMAHFANGHGLYSSHEYQCLSIPAEILTLWQQHGGRHSCLGKPAQSMRMLSQQHVGITCFDKGYIETDLNDGMSRIHCPWFRSALCR